MRIIGGTARGRRLYTAAGLTTRPTADKVRESLFNILAREVPEAVVCDLFGGSGALALEALSRGARSAIVTDCDRDAQKIILRNAQAVLGDAWAERLTLLCTDYHRAIDTMAGTMFDIVFLDPPYRMREVYADALTRLRAIGAIGADTVVVAEYKKGPPPPLPDDFCVQDTRRYGETEVLLAVLKEEDT